MLHASRAPIKLGILATEHEFLAPLSHVSHSYGTLYKAIYTSDAALAGQVSRKLRTSHIYVLNLYEREVAAAVRVSAHARGT